ncbi:MAG TPA: hypothetical protein VFF33_08175 [Ignavibacteriaceae bacterium]|nr:hypothetical protein [Ignavibacteriaceae bacterium]
MKKNHKNILIIVSTIFLLYIILFEFIIPKNHFLPQPSIVLMSFPFLFTDYNIEIHLLSTIAIVYSSLLLSYLLLWSLKKHYHKKQDTLLDFVFSIEWFSEFIPGILIGLILIYWFPNSELVEFVFTTFISFSYLFIKAHNESRLVPVQYAETFAVLNADKEFISSNIIWKYIQPSLMNHFKDIHLYLWSLLIAFEYIRGGWGIGSMIRNLFNNHDLSGLFSTLIIIGVIIFIGNFIINTIKKKIFHWSI